APSTTAEAGAAQTSPATIAHRATTRATRTVTGAKVPQITARVRPDGHRRRAASGRAAAEGRPRGREREAHSDPHRHRERTDPVVPPRRGADGEAQGLR